MLLSHGWEIREKQGVESCHNNNELEQRVEIRVQSCKRSSMNWQLSTTPYLTTCVHLRVRLDEPVGKRL
jgi:hypothetical protein